MSYRKRLQVVAIAGPLGALALLGGSVAFAANQDGGTAGDTQTAQQQATPSPATPAPTTPEDPGATPSDGQKPSDKDCPNMDGARDGAGSGTSTNTGVRSAHHTRGTGTVQY